MTKAEREAYIRKALVRYRDETGRDDDAIDDLLARLAEVYSREDLERAFLRDRLRRGKKEA